MSSPHYTRMTVQTSLKTCRLTPGVRGCLHLTRIFVARHTSPFVSGHRTLARQKLLLRILSADHLCQNWPERATRTNVSRESPAVTGSLTLQALGGSGFRPLPEADRQMSCAVKVPAQSDFRRSFVSAMVGNFSMRPPLRLSVSSESHQR